MRYTYEQEPLTCVGIEKELGLPRGEVRELKIEPDGTIEVDVTKDLTSTQMSKLKSLFELKEKVIT